MGHAQKRPPSPPHYTPELSRSPGPDTTKRGCCCNVVAPELLCTAEHGKTCRVVFFFLCRYPRSCLALARRKTIPRKAPAPRDFERLEHAPRSMAGARTCSVVYTRAPRVRRKRQRGKQPAPGGEMQGNVKKKCISYIYIHYFIHTRTLYAHACNPCARYARLNRRPIQGGST